MEEQWYSHLSLAKKEEPLFLEAFESVMNRLKTTSEPTGEDARVVSMEEARKVSISDRRMAIFFHACSELGIDSRQVGAQFRTEG